MTPSRSGCRAATTASVSGTLVLLSAWQTRERNFVPAGPLTPGWSRHVGAAHSPAVPLPSSGAPPRQSRRPRRRQSPERPRTTPRLHPRPRPSDRARAQYYSPTYQQAQPHPPPTHAMPRRTRRRSDPTSSEPADRPSTRHRVARRSRLVPTSFTRVCARDGVSRHRAPSRCMGLPQGEAEKTWPVIVSSPAPTRSGAGGASGVSLSDVRLLVQ